MQNEILQMGSALLLCNHHHFRYGYCEITQSHCSRLLFLSRDIPSLKGTDGKVYTRHTHTLPMLFVK